MALLWVVGAVYGVIDKHVQQEACLRFSSNKLHVLGITKRRIKPDLIKWEYRTLKKKTNLN